VTAPRARLPDDPGPSNHRAAVDPHVPLRPGSAAARLLRALPTGNACTAKAAADSARLHTVAARELARAGLVAACDGAPEAAGLYPTVELTLSGLAALRALLDWETPP
jgi:hypothetical protein